MLKSLKHQQVLPTTKVSKVRITEIFGTALQGEGVFIGQPCTFIRLAGCVPPFCNFCDTKYSWESGKEMSLKQILKEVSKYPSNQIIITGGEPFAQKKELKKLIEMLQYHLYYINIETSGKCEIKSILPKVWVTMSPKQFNGVFKIARSRDLNRVDEFKFVVETENEAHKAFLFIQEHGLDKSICGFMPKGQTRKEQIASMQKVLPLCVKYGIKMSPRLHILMFDKKRGV
jgi:7-carboxy-7-deazaguanine synthase